MKRLAAVSAAGFVLAAFVLAGCSRKPGAGGGTQRPAPGDVELVEISAAWNPACRMQAPLVEKLAKDYAGRVDVRVIDVEVEHVSSDREAACLILRFRGGRSPMRL